MQTNEVEIRIKTDLSGSELNKRLESLNRFLSSKGATVKKDGDTHILEFEFGQEGFPLIEVRAKVRQESPESFIVKLKSLSKTNLLSYCQSYHRRKPEQVFRPHLEGILKKGAKRHGSAEPEKEVVAQA